MADADREEKLAAARKKVKQHHRYFLSIRAFTSLPFGVI